MKTLILLIATALTAAGTAARAATQDVHLFILSGQSNMEGLNPDLSFKPALVNAFGAAGVVIVKDAQSGQPISRWYKKWAPKTGNPPKVCGDLYDRLMVKVIKAVSNQTFATITFVWMQGESDALEKKGEVYADSLRGLIRQLRDDLQRKDMLVVIGRLSDFGGTNNPQWRLVREAEVAVAEADPLAAWVDTDDLNGEKNGLHYTKDGYRELGKRFAEKSIAIIKQR
jgi:hypothetical protein